VAVPETSSSKADEIALALEDEILSGALPPGTVLRQEHVSERFHVSRTPIREAFGRLAGLGLVSFEPNRGVRVRTISRDDLQEAFLVRAELESLATALAVPRMTDEDFAALDAAEERFAELTLELRQKARAGISAPQLASEWMRANYAFHDVIYEASGAPYVAMVARNARRTFSGQIAWAARSELDELYAKNDEQHQAIRQAIAAGSVEGARALAREHVISSGALLGMILSYAENGGERV
jgi:DNA-binding GntR family transcriptional regulator